MITQEQYQELSPYFQGIKNFKQNGSYRGDGLIVINEIRQAKGMEHINFSCDACKYAALMDAYNWIMEYEKHCENIVKNENNPPT